MPDKKLSSEEVIKQIQYIEGNPSFSIEEKKTEIAKLQKFSSDKAKATKKA